MTTAPHIPSHMRFLIAGIQDRAMDLALLGHISVKTELDITDGHAVFELVTRPHGVSHQHPDHVRITTDLHGVVNQGDSRQPLDTALSEARRDLAAMLDHLNALTDQEMPA